MIKKVPGWKPEPLPDRLERCRWMLYANGHLTNVESENIKQRLAAALRGESVNVEVAPTPRRGRSRRAR